MTPVSDPPTSSRDALRAAVSLSPSHRVILSPGPSTRDTAHEDAVWVGSILRLIDDRFRIVIWGRGNRVDRVVQRAAALKQPDTLLIAERSLKRRITEDELFTLADAALILGTDVQNADWIARCRSIRLPLVTLARPNLPASVQTDDKIHIVPRFAPPAVAEQILKLFDPTPAARS